MQTQSADDDLRLDFYCKDPESKTAADCPSFYRTNRASWVVQGQALGAAAAAQLRGLKDGETFLEVPEPLIERFVLMYVEEKYGVDIAASAR